MRRKQPLTFFLGFFLSAFLLTVSCNKEAEVSFAERSIFQLAPNTPEVVKYIASQIKRQDREQPFIQKIIEQEGEILWSKFDIDSTLTTTSVRIPLVRVGTDFVNSYILFKNQNGSCELSLIRGSMYARYGFETEKAVNANSIIADLFKLNNQIFGDTLFQVYDDRLFGLRQFDLVPPFLITYRPSHKNSSTVSSNAVFPPPAPGYDPLVEGPTCSRTITANYCNVISDTGPLRCKKITVIFTGGSPCTLPPTPPPVESNGVDYAPGSAGGTSLNMTYTFPPCPGMTPQQCEDATTPVIRYGAFTAVQGYANEVENRTPTSSEIQNWNPNFSDAWIFTPIQPIPRPNFATFISKYPKNTAGTGDMPIAQLVRLIGGTVETKYSQGEVKNGCALRVSMALNKSGVAIPNILNQTWKGADGKYYFYRAAHLFNWLNKVFGPPDISKTAADGAPNGVNFFTHLRGIQNRGIYVMEPSDVGSFGATGHATFWGGLDAFGGNNFFAAAKNVYIWRLPN